MLFPLSAALEDGQRLTLGGCAVGALADEYGTPLYVFDEPTIREQARQARAAFGQRWNPVTALYATKAFFAPFLAQLYREEGLGLDVTSEGEMVIARRVHFDPARIYVHGNNKTPAELRAALDMGITHFVADSLDDLVRLEELAEPAGARPAVLLRLAPHIDAHTHRYLTTGAADSKFGLGIANGAAELAARAALQSKRLDLVGLHFHIGSQVFDTDALNDALHVVLAAAADWQRRLGFSLRELNIGGGWGVAYNETQTALDVKAFAERTTSALRDGLRAQGLSDNIHLIIEPGRALIARAAVAVYRVGLVKTIPGVRAYAMVDGGMGDNVRPALYGAQYQPYLANRMNEAPTQDYAIAGRYCEQGDVLVGAARLPKIHTGDLLAIPVAGAYQLPMASNYNMIPRPAVVLVGDGKERLVRRRETIQDMLACDLVQIPK